MKKPKHKKTKASGIIISFFCYFLILIFSSKISQEVHRTIIFCLETIVPSMFTMLTFSFFMLSFPIPSVIIQKMEILFNYAFGLSGNCAQAFFAGITGGYNISPVAAVKLLNNGYISREQAKRLAIFFSSPGFSFTVNIAGIAIYNSFFTGIKLFLSGIMADILIAFFYNRIHKNNERSLFLPSEERSFSDAFTASVDSASKTIISICSRIIIFSAVRIVLISALPFSFIKTFLGLFAEVSSAVSFSKENYSLNVTAFCLFFGGFSVFIQQISDIRQLGIHPFFYLLTRIIRSLSGTAIFSIIDYFFPERIPASVTIKKIALHSVNPIYSLSLLLLCAVFISVIKKDRADAEIQHKPFFIYNNRTCFNGKYMVKLTQEKLKE